MKFVPPFIIFSKNEKNVNSLKLTIIDLISSSNLIAIDNYQALVNTVDKFSTALIIIDDSVLYQEILSVALYKRDNKKFIGAILLISSKISPQDASELLNSGVDFFLLSINSPENVNIAIKSAYFALLNELELRKTKDKIEKHNQLLQDAVIDTLKISTKIIRTLIPKYDNIVENSYKAVVWIAKEMGESDDIQIFEMKVATLLSYAGKAMLNISDKNTIVMPDGMPSDMASLQIPYQTKQLIETCGIFEKAAKIAYHIFENLDGSGMPDKLQAWQIPLESRIIRVAIDFFGLYESTGKVEPAINYLKTRVKRLYDHRFVDLMEQYIKSINLEGENYGFEGLLPMELKEGMILAKDLVSASGVKLIKEKTQLTERTVGFIQAHITTDPIIGYVYIYRS